MKRLVCLGALSVSLSACVSVQYLPAKPTTYAPTNSVEVLFEKPTRSHTVLGVIVAETQPLISGLSQFTTEETLLEEAKEKARQIGAHAIVVTHTGQREVVRSSTTGGMCCTPYGGMYGGTTSISSDTMRRVEVLAIRFDVESAPVTIPASRPTAGPLSHPTAEGVRSQIPQGESSPPPTFDDPARQRVYESCMRHTGWLELCRIRATTSTEPLPDTQFERKSRDSTSQTAEDDYVNSLYFRLANQYHAQVAPLGKERALDQIKAFAEEGDIEWQAFLGMFYLIGQQAPLNFTEALNLLQRAWKEGKPHDLKQAFYWFQRAATQGNSSAQELLGNIYFWGAGVRKDVKMAIHWWREAAQQGNANAQTALGVSYRFGVGVPQDFIKAHMWLNLAAAQGDEEARKVRDRLAEFMTRDQLAEAQRLAREWKPKRK